MTVTPSWSERQGQLSRAILEPLSPIPAGVLTLGTPASPKRFNVYRNNVAVKWNEALAANYPVIAALVGDVFFAAMARVFATRYPPSSPIMALYGAQFAQFLEDFEPVAHLPYLGSVARIERASTLAYHARDEPSLDLGALRQLQPEHASDLSFKLHGSLELLRSAYPALQIWAMHVRGEEPHPVCLDGPECTLVLRRGNQVEALCVPEPSFEFVWALGQGMTLEGSFIHAQSWDPQFDLTQNLFQLIELGALSDFELGSQQGTPEHALVPSN